MVTLITLVLLAFTVLNIYLAYIIHSLRSLLKSSLTLAEGQEVKSRELKILCMLSKDNTILREYVIYNAPIFVYPFAADTVSLVGSLMQICSVCIFAASLFWFNPYFLLWSAILFVFSGYTGSRFNKKAMFNEAVKNFTSKIAPYNEEFFNYTLSHFHERYFQELMKN